VHDEKGSRRISEINYCALLNRVLPEDIRVLAWSPVVPEFSARFSATHRIYRYFFMKKDLDLDKMTTAAELLVGEHDFRNLAKLDVLNVSNFVRTVISARIVPFNSSPTTDLCSKYAVYMLEIKGNAFLWHM
jgi:tRNA pseudouridine38/39 synthase